MFYKTVSMSSYFDPLERSCLSAQRMLVKLQGAEEEEQNDNDIENESNLG